MNKHLSIIFSLGILLLLLLLLILYLIGYFETKKKHCIWGHHYYKWSEFGDVGFVPNVNEAMLAWAGFEVFKKTFQDINFIVFIKLQ